MDRRKHILLLSSWYPSEQHPFLGNFVERQARLLLQHYDVTVLVTENGENLDFEVLDQYTEGLREIRVRHPRSSKLLARRRTMEQALQTGLQRIQNVHLIIGHIALQKGLQFVQAKKYFSCPLILVEHASYYRPEIRAKRSWIESIVLRKTRRHCDAVVAVSEFLKNDMRADFPKHTIHVIGNPVDENLFAPKEKSAHAHTEFLHISTLDERTKNPEGILRAFRRLKEENDHFHLTIISDEDYSRWQELAQHFDLQAHVHFVGPLSWQEIPAFFHRADAFVLFSNYESFSIVLAEAWMTGTPVISTPVGIAANLPDYLGLTIPAEDDRALAGALREFMEGREKYSLEKISSYGARYGNAQILKEWDNLLANYLG